ncbi:MAG: PAS domain S-box protein [Gemmataceae bacterium]|nr:PAS domain S-box protein [Gemmataceae bacterium]
MVRTPTLLEDRSMFDFLTHLFDTSDFPARWDCGNWSAAHGWLHILSDLGIWSAYFAIPCLLVSFVLRRRDLPFPSLFFLFGAFILACGTTHLMEAIIFWHPLYRLAGVIKWFTALVSWVTVIALVPIIPKALALRSPEELEREITARKEAQHALERANDELERRVEERTAELAKANAALQTERDRFHTTLSSIGDAVITTDHEGRVTFLNGVAANLTGWTKEEGVGQPLDAVFPIINERTRRPAENPAVRALAEGAVVGLANHTVLVSKEKTERPIDDSAAPIRDAGGRVLGVVLVFRDVTERRRAEQALRDSEERLRMAQQVAHVGTFEWNVQTGVNTWTPELEAMYGLPPGGFPGTQEAWEQLVHPEDRPHAVQRVSEALAHGGFADEWRVIRPDGSVRWLAGVARVFRDEAGQPLRLLGINIDVTERKEAEQRLRVSEERYRLAAEAVNGIIYDLDLRTGIVARSRGLLELTGYHPDEVPPTAEWWMSQIHEDDRRDALQTFASEDEGGSGRFEIEYRVRHRDGKWRRLVDRSILVRDKAGKIVRQVGCSQDVTARREAEESIAEANRRKDEFLAMLAHELRNPLAPITNAIQILGLIGSPEPRLRQVRDIIVRQVQHMVRLVDDLLDVSRISRGKIELRTERLDLAAALESAVETSRPLIEAGKHELTITLLPAPLFVVGDLTRLAQIFANLLNNSAKYTPEAGRVWLTLEQEWDRAVVRVRDNGIGIPPEMLPKVFDLFTQVDRRVDRGQGGLGIGLTLVKRLVEMHGGTVEARSEGPAKGSEFVVRLPLAPPVAEGQQSAGLERASDKGKASACRVLVVDDNRDAAESLAMLLRLTESLSGEFSHEIRGPW